MVTSNAAAMMNKSDVMGSLQPGRSADVSILKMTSGRYTFADGAGNKFTGTRRLKPVVAMRKGKLYEPVSDLLPEWIRQAA
ncbi:MAG: amidohydrolase/deacetylase family metallohydrolase, partial [Alphaproteobacteria bacterium]|nr:amidohydrolase/deacetylase family metallohydrolase [Alphaproteobacteria bacterium]